MQQNVPEYAIAISRPHPTPPPLAPVAESETTLWDESTPPAKIVAMPTLNANKDRSAYISWH